MRIVWFNATLVQSGGGERLSLEATTHFQRLGHEVLYAAYEHDPSKVFDGAYPLPYAVAPQFPAGPLRPLRRVLWLRSVLRGFGPDIVFTQGTWGQVIHAYLAAFGTGIPYAVHVFGSLFAFPPSHERTKYALAFRRHLGTIRDSLPGYRTVVPAEPPSMGPLERMRLEAYAWLKRAAVRKAAVSFTLSRRNAWETSLLYGRESVVLKGAFPSRIFRHAPDPAVRGRWVPPGGLAVLSVCRLAVNKRVDLLIRAFELAARTRPEAVLLIGGSGPEEANLRALAASTGLGDRIRFIGFVEDRALWDLMSACDVFVSLDLADFDIAPYEALGLGRKAVWTDEMETDAALAESGRVFPAAPEAAQVAQALTQALAAPPPGRPDEDLAPYTWERYSEAMLDAVRGALR